MRADRLKLIYWDGNGLVYSIGLERARQDQNARLEPLVASFKKALSEAEPEKIDPDQFALQLEDIETAIAQVEAEVDASECTASVRLSKPRRTNLGSLSKHLEPVEVVVGFGTACAPTAISSGRTSASAWTLSRPNSLHPIPRDCDPADGSHVGPCSLSQNTPIICPCIAMRKSIVARHRPVSFNPGSLDWKSGF
jgi:hypothetical protein